MTQHDLDVADQLFPATRTDINNALKALGNQQKGGTAPSGPLAGWLWLDDSGSPWILKLYDGTDWISIGTFNTTTNLFVSDASVQDVDFSSNGLMIRRASGTYTNRTIVGGTGIALTKGNGVSGNPSVAIDPLVVGQTGKHSIPIAAGAMYSRTTAGAAAGSVESTTNKVMIKTMDFQGITAEQFAQFQFPIPKSWDSTVNPTFRVFWSHSGASRPFVVKWKLALQTLGNSDALDTAFGTAIAVADTGGTNGDVFISRESSGITVAGAGAEELMIGELSRDPLAAGDTLITDARVHGIELFLTTNIGNDV